MQFAHGEQGAGEGAFLHGMEKITLVFVGVDAFEQQGPAIPILAAHVVAGGDQVGTENFGVFEKHLELDFPVAKDVRVGGATGPVLGEEVGEDVVPVVGGKIRGVESDAEPVAHGLGVGQIGHGGAVFGAVVLVPVFHEQAFDPVALLHQQQGGDRRIDPPGHADHHKRLVHRVDSSGDIPWVRLFTTDNG